MVIEGARKQLLAEYTATLVEERVSWTLLNEPGLAPAAHVSTFARWKAAARRLKALAGQLHEGAVAPPSPLPR